MVASYALNHTCMKGVPARLADAKVIFNPSALGTFSAGTVVPVR
jgi:hypothetical protein